MLQRIYHQPHDSNSREECYYIDPVGALSAEQHARLEWLIRQPLGHVSAVSIYADKDVVEIGPKRSRVTADSTNAVGIATAMEIPVKRIEKSIRYCIAGSTAVALIEQHLDRMTHEVYPAPLTEWGAHAAPQSVRAIRVLEEGRSALEAINSELKLGIDDEDLDYYLGLFRDTLKRNPTDVEMSRIGIGNSEHCRHGFWNAIHTIDGREMPESLMDIAKDPWKKHPGNSRLAFNDNSGALGRRAVLAFAPIDPRAPSLMDYKQKWISSTATAESHNHPTFIEAFEGAATGAGGRQRDDVAVRRGAHIRAGVVGYSTANLAWKAPRRYESPLAVLIKGSNGASDYGNKFGEPLIGGFATSVDLVVNGQRRAYVKPILYTGGIGVIEEENLEKRNTRVGMLLVRIGGPAYRVGVGGGSASSMGGGANDAELDYQSVQRGDAQMANKVYRVIRACAELAKDNPIEVVSDQGAGGPANLFTELMAPLGGRVDIRKIIVGDPTMSVREIDIGEYQEGYGVVVDPNRIATLVDLCVREGVNCEILGEITGDGNVVVVDSEDGSMPVNLPLKQVLTDLPRKRFSATRPHFDVSPFVVPKGKTAGELLKAVFSQLQVHSKGFLVHKADRSVTGLVRQQQCVGPFQLALANCGVMADSYKGYSGTAEAVSQQQALMILNPAAGARLALANALIKLASAGITSIADAKFRVNWMWPAKKNGEVALIYEAASALRDLMILLETAGDGGKDSSSMYAELAEGVVLAPGALILLGYAPVTDHRKVLTPALAGDGVLGFIDLGKGKNRLGGSLLAQTFGELGNEAPDIDDPGLLSRAVSCMNGLVRGGRSFTAYHKRSGGGLITTLAEMCMAGNCGAQVSLADGSIPALFSQEAGMVFECRESEHHRLEHVFNACQVPVEWIGRTSKESRQLSIRAGDSKREVFSETLTALRHAWEAPSLALELHQSNPETVRQEEQSVRDARVPLYHCTFVPKKGRRPRKKPLIMVLREEGSNGDREMAAAFYEAGCDPVIVSMNDLRAGRVTSLERFQMAVLTGGFAGADVFGSGKGWAGSIRYNPRIRAMFEEFFERADTLSLGVCNGAQVLPFLGHVPWRGIPEAAQPRFVRNASGRFEMRWTRVKVLPSPAVLMQDMEGSILGVPEAHGEGLLRFPDSQIADEVWKRRLVPLAFVNPEGDPTEVYPYNPNGSPHGWTALCSSDGRHLAMMPHPERCFLPWQWHYWPEEFWHYEASPWLQMFQNARAWLLEHA